MSGSLSDLDLYRVQVKNVTEITMFILMGFTDDFEAQVFLFLLFLAIYLFTLIGNLGLVFLVIVDSRLHNPMYYFLNASFTSVTTPRLIIDLLFQRRTISWRGCLTQIFLEHFLAASEVIVLTVMAYDRYVAICKPLHYTAIMRQGLCQLLVVAAWIGGILHATVQILFTMDLTFCGPNVIDHFTCDFFSLLELACSDTYRLGMAHPLLLGAICTVSFIILFISYVVILHSLRNHSAEGRRKALSTCTSHFIVVVIFFGPCIFIYTRPPTTFPLDKMVAVFYTIGTPLLNPLIYTLRNEEVKNAVKMLWCSKA
ncbi:unnamed protein product [Rangifer tarandus platyrhynchus]|uniref:Uncharacterized protein n=1 Tax=Rangifer tarandus platyrhynchus TaxID=3082113 RepID=A0AC59Y6R7_RANTA